MRWGRVMDVARKEVLSTIRDHRALVSNILLPLILLPVIMLGMPLLLGGLFEREATTVTQLGVAGAENMPATLRAAIEAQNVELVPVADPEAAVRDDEVPAAIAVPERFAEEIAAGGKAEVRVYGKSGNMRSELNASKLQAAVSAYQRSVVAERLGAEGLDPSILEPVAVTQVDASTEAERSSGMLSWLIPFFIAIWTLTGGQMTAIDATAGEKERGTLESLLVAPVRRSEVVLGKFLATLTFGLTAALAAIAGYLVGGMVMRNAFLPRMGAEGGEITAMMGGSLSVDAVSVLLLLMSAVLLAAVVAAVLLSICLFARSFKEAQSYIAPLSFVFVIPAVALQFKDLIGLGEGAYMVPVFNALLVMDDIVKGSASASNILVTWVSLAVVIAVLLAFAHRNFTREDVIFRS
ncbi:MAG TPA: ABC transporter permease subunit [Trueperaceae bacterium]|mgnify:CR=1 FL=1|nr:ABC transporter permease subunit [Trueperaceae bacterium]